MDWNDPTLWVAVGFFIFVAAVFKVAKKTITGALDGRAEDIRNSLDQAAGLREEAQQLLAEYQRKQRDAVKETEQMLAHARAEAERMAKEGAEKLEEALKRREQLAVEKIAQAETDAIREVRAISVDVAVAATRSLIASNMDAGKSGAMVDEAISDLSKKLH
ncbi:MAG: F0F1 ATP synthase subunit B [Rhodospirillaceae bacterium]|jgi:F-type H+-transporting ATPase subunit b|nr:F0F1 ATP synthase subunit B [Rhodospirillaceae bacterium]MBT6286409.1 F0F1 ATP synthase subunit B [Rhodospirillaceae bacterium]